MVVFDPHDERRWAEMSGDDRAAEHERLRDNYLGQLEERVCQLDFARRNVQHLEGEVRRLRERLDGHNERLPRTRRQSGKSERQILASDSDRVRYHRAQVEHLLGAEDMASS